MVSWKDLEIPQYYNPLSGLWWVKETDFSSPQFLPRAFLLSSVFSLTPPLIIIMCVIFLKLKELSHTFIFDLYNLERMERRYPFIQMRALSPKELIGVLKVTQKDIRCRARSTRSSGPEAITPFTHQTMLVLEYWFSNFQVYHRITWEAFHKCRFIDFTVRVKYIWIGVQESAF